MKKGPLFLCLVFIACWSCGTDDSASSEAVVVAEAENVEVTSKDLLRALDAESEMVRRRFNNSYDEKQKYVKVRIRNAILLQEAHRRKIHQRPKVVRRYEAMLVSELVREMRKAEQGRTVEDSDLKKVYQEEMDKFSRPALIRASLLVVAKKDEAEQIRKDLGDNPPIDKFLALVKEKSIHKSRSAGGDLGLIHPNSAAIKEEVRLEAAKLRKNGELSGVFRVAGSGWGLLYRTGGRDAHVPEFAQIRPLLRSRYLRKRKEQSINAVLGMLTLVTVGRRPRSSFGTCAVLRRHPRRRWRRCDRDGWTGPRCLHGCGS